jgi:hypothetical protein
MVSIDGVHFVKWQRLAQVTAAKLASAIRREGITCRVVKGKRGRTIFVRKSDAQAATAGSLWIPKVDPGAAPNRAGRMRFRTGALDRRRVRKRPSPPAGDS